MSVQLKDEVARALHSRAARSRESRALEQALADLGVSLAPVHPGSDDPVTRAHFAAHVAADHAADVADALRKVDAVEAAYVKPSAEAP